MVGNASSWLIPNVSEWRLNWLAHAEISASPDEPSKVGLSAYQFDPSEYGAFAESLPPQLVDLEAEMRGRLDLDPRRWTKLHYRDSEIQGYSQYFVLDPRHHYPIASLRLGLKRMGLEDVSRIEPGFRSALECRDSLWALIAKWKDGKPHPRLSCMIPPSLLGTVLDELRMSDFIEDRVVQRLVEVAKSLGDTPHVFVSLDPETPNAVAVDFERVAPGNVPQSCSSLWCTPTPTEAARYLKCRLDPATLEPTWTVYRPLAEVIPEDEFERLITTSDHTRTRAQAYYDREHATILEAVGSTYQAGLLGQSDAATTVRHLISASGIQPGDRVVDLGCGSGGPAIQIARTIADTKVVGVTISIEQANAGRRLIAEAGLQDRVAIICGDYHQLPFEDSLFDRVVFFESLGYAEDMLQVMCEAFRVLRPGGTLYVKDVVRKPDPTRAEALELAEFDRVYHQRTSTPNEIAIAIHKAGFVDLRGESLSGVANAIGFHQAMIDPSQPDGLTPFGRSHYRTYLKLPVTFAHFSALKPGSPRES